MVGRGFRLRDMLVGPHVALAAAVSLSSQRHYFLRYPTVCASTIC
jgi:hypothetical protein